MLRERNRAGQPRRGRLDQRGAGPLGRPDSVPCDASTGGARVADQVLRLTRQEPVRPQLRLRRLLGACAGRLRRPLGTHPEDRASRHPWTEPGRVRRRGFGRSELPLQLGLERLRPAGPGHELADEQPVPRPPLARRLGVGPGTRRCRRDEPLRTEALQHRPAEDRAARGQAPDRNPSRRGGRALRPRTELRRRRDRRKALLQRREPRGMRLPAGRRRRDPARDPASLRTAARTRRRPARRRREHPLLRAPGQQLLQTERTEIPGRTARADDHDRLLVRRSASARLRRHRARISGRGRVHAREVDDHRRPRSAGAPAAGGADLRGRHRRGDAGRPRDRRGRLAP